MREELDGEGRMGDCHTLAAPISSPIISVTSHGSITHSVTHYRLSQLQPWMLSVANRNIYWGSGDGHQQGRVRSLWI